MIAALATLLAGVVIGYAGQRSRMCFIGGIRDFLLVRDTGLLAGLAAFLAAGWLLLPALTVRAGAAAPLAQAADGTLALLAIAGGAGVGVFSTLANGCPFRQHVLAAQGDRGAWAYLAGFAAGAAIFHAWVLPALLRVLS